MGQLTILLLKGIQCYDWNQASPSTFQLDLEFFMSAKTQNVLLDAVA